MMEREEKNRLILAELARLYPDAKPALHFANPFQLLVAVVLSAQCTDVKVNMVTPALFAAYPDAAALAKAEPEEIEPYIKTCGLFHNKAKNLVLMARELVARFGGEVPADHDALESLPGVGRKTANVVMSCAFGEDAIAVRFDQPQRAIAPGQAVVLYDGDTVIGGATNCPPEKQ